MRWKLICARFGVGRIAAWYRSSAALLKIAERLNARVVVGTKEVHRGHVVEVDTGRVQVSRLMATA